jgi:hypothetical protein
VDRCHFLRCLGPRPDGRRGRYRRCLLKGCERPFRPPHPQARYCSASCRQAARRWRRWQASRRYRATAHGHERRREQQRRYRQRCRQRQVEARAAAVPTGVPALREGQRPGSKSEDFWWRPCARPGCYVLFAVWHAYWPRRFCSLACCLALRRVLDREARYRARRRRTGRPPLRRRPRPADTS